MSFDVPERVHVAPFGIEHDRIVDPAVEYGADRVVLLRYLPAHLPSRVGDDDVTESLEAAGIAVETVDTDVSDLFDAVAAVGEVLDRYEAERVYVNLASGNKVTAIGGMIACMASGDAEPYYVEAEEHGSHHPPAPKGVADIDSIPSYPIERPSDQHLAVMQFIASADTTTADGDPYRIKRELFEFGERRGLPFMSEYEGETSKGKFRRLDAHVVTPLEAQGYVSVESVGTKKRVTLTEDGENTLRAFAYVLDD